MHINIYFFFLKRWFVRALHVSVREMRSHHSAVHESWSSGQTVASRENFELSQGRHAWSTDYWIGTNNFFFSSSYISSLDIHDFPFNLFFPLNFVRVFLLLFILFKIIYKIVIYFSISYAFNFLHLSYLVLFFLLLFFCSLFLSWFILFFNFIPRYFILFSFYTIFSPYYFDYYFLLLFSWFIF